VLFEEDDAVDCEPVREDGKKSLQPCLEVHVADESEDDGCGEGEWSAPKLDRSRLQRLTDDGAKDDEEPKVIKNSYASAQITSETRDRLGAHIRGMA
jgi:hypothetical protein